MRLSQVVRYFNHSKFFDSYTGEELGVGQLDVFDETKRDGLTAQRRIFEVAPDVDMPPRMAIQFHDENWIVGLREIDAFKGKVLRHKHVLHQAEGLAEYSTIKQLLEDAIPTKAYAARVWTKSSSEVEISSEKFAQLQIYFSRAENVRPNQIIKLSGKLHTVMSVYPAAAGHLVASSEELEDEALEVGNVPGTGQWNPITEQYEGGSTQVKLLRLRWQSDFAYYSEATPDFERGDLQAACMTRLTNGTEIELSDGNWTVKASQEREGVYYLHLRRA